MISQISGVDLSQMEMIMRNVFPITAAAIVELDSLQPVASGRCGERVRTEPCGYRASGSRVTECACGRDYSGSPALRRPSWYLARSSGRRKGK